jgi:predicted DNA-binding protein
MKRKNFFLTENQIEKLKELADRTGLKASEHIRRAIDSYLEQQERKEEG